jgi:serine/threonine protein kinase/Flp pilus assembly protein TadD
VIPENISHYRILGLIGKGGMGEVYLAEDTKLGRRVALKVLPQEFASDESRMRRFIKEAKAASAFTHPNVASIHELGESESVAFIAMEFVEGQTLDAAIKESSLAISRVVEIAIQMADALEEAHSKGITHRDIKPGNIMLTKRGQVKVLDFGLAKITAPNQDEAVTLSTLTATEPGTILGTVAYMSPEQALGQSIDHRSDLFSLGVVLYQMVTGRLPFRGESASKLIDQILHSQPEAISRFNYNVPAELERIIRKCLNKDRDSRYQSARDLLIDLNNLKRDNTETPAIPKNRSLPRRLIFSLLFAFSLLTAAFVILQLRTRQNYETIDSVAVLPFTHINPNAETEYLIDGISESLMYDLSQVSKLKVISRTSSFVYKGRTIDLQKIGNELGVRAIVTGKIRETADTLLISTELVDTKENRILWGQQYSRNKADLLTLQNEIVKDISSNLRLKLTTEENKKLTKDYTKNREAYELYLRGRYHWSKRSRKDLDKAIQFFNQAIEKDPLYALAYSGLADTYDVLVHNGHISPEEGIRQLMVAAEKALELDDSLAEAHLSLSNAKFAIWDTPAGIHELETAIRLNPNYASARQFNGMGFQFAGQFEEAEKEMRRAYELDPFSIPINYSLGVVLANAGRTGEALKQCKKLEELYPQAPMAHGCLSWTYEKMGNFHQVIAEEEKARTLSGEDSAVAAKRAAELKAALEANGERGYRQKLLELLKKEAEQKYVAPSDFAALYAYLGQKQQAFEWLEKAYQSYDPGLYSLKINPLYASLRSDPRYQQMLKRIGLPIQ